MAKAKFYGTGRRKKSVARVYLVPGTGNITINGRDIDEYLGLETLKVIVRQPLVLTETEGKFDVIVNVKGGGYTGQAGFFVFMRCCSTISEIVFFKSSISLCRVKVFRRFMLIERICSIMPLSFFNCSSDIFR